jgi:asparagine synthase (glutamine-hydrolysing)
MCGIAGIFLQNNSHVSSEDLEDMCDVIRHRGPDDKGQYIDGSVGLGHRRLKIIDLSLKAHQPMSNEDRTVWIVFNGEIYNFLELSQKLRAKGHRFISQSDTEVAVHAYEEYGEDCINHFNGMFAFAVWDKKNRKLFLARDRLGIKPLYYTCQGGKFLFASEIKSILQDKTVKRNLNFEAIDNYLTFRYVPGEETFFSEIKKLPPAHCLVIRERGFIKRSYWSIDLNLQHENRRDKLSYVEEFADILNDSIKLRLRSDVPIGVYLSGGLDSSSITAIVRSVGYRIKYAFNMGFGLESDENIYAEELARRLGVDNYYNALVNPDDFDLLPEIIWHLEEPVGDAIIIPSYLLAKLASDQVKVVLTGEGADELLAGYIQQEVLFKADHLKRYAPALVRSILSQLVKIAPVMLLNHCFQYPSSIGREGKERLVQFLNAIDNKAESYLIIASLFSNRDKQELYSENFKSYLNKSNIINDIRIFLNSNTHSLFKRLLLQEFRYWLPCNILHKQDKLMMANSVEGRVPFLDHRLVEFIMKVPVDLFRNNTQNKIILRRAVKDLLPKRIRTRKKQAFFMPLGGKFQNRFLQLAHEYLNKDRLRSTGLINYKYIEQILGEVDNSALIYHKQLMALIILEIWFDVFKVRP